MNSRKTRFKARESLGDLLRQRREEKGWEVERLAEHTGLSVHVIVNTEKGVVNPSRSDFQEIIRVLGLSKKASGEAGRLLGIIHPRIKKRLKFQSKKRSRRHGYR